ncbi:MAG: asparagine synthase (glutamine-hydrolyzing) [Bacteroidota bacterium]
MCGIVGYRSLTNRPFQQHLEKAVGSLNQRGPDTQGIDINGATGMGHTRLAIIDTTTNGKQPMSDETGRYTLVFNGEIYNYQSLKKELNGITWKSSTDTEVLLQLLIHDGPDCLPKLNGFFALAFYDKKEERLLLARDGMGIKPLHYYTGDELFAFGSEMKALFELPIPRKLNHEALYWYLKLNYLPGNLSLIEDVEKLEPGHYLSLKNNILDKKAFWKLSDREEKPFDGTYESAQNQLIDLLDRSVQDRLISDVTLGAFLSGGTDSSAIVSLASRHHQHLNTFSIGYKDHPFFDETHYAEMVAKKFNTNHTVFSLTNDDLLNDLSAIVSYIDEPFGDSSTIPTYILSKYVKKHVTVALSGDGADELFGGYYKHLALHKALHPSITNQAIKWINPLTAILPQSRSGKITNLIRRANRFGRMLKMEPLERYWFLASLTNDPSFLLKESVNSKRINTLKSRFVKDHPTLNDYLDADLQVVLPGDMLTKVDLMSMANSLEVRVPFLDHRVVSFARSLPENFKVQGGNRKRVLQDAFRKTLPNELYNRSKKGFEVPMLNWMRNELSANLGATLFDEDFLQHQDIFHVPEVMNFRKKLQSANPGDVHGPVWALYVFQKWYKKYLEV